MGTAGTRAKPSSCHTGHPIRPATSRHFARVRVPDRLRQPCRYRPLILGCRAMRLVREVGLARVANDGTTRGLRYAVATTSGACLHLTTKGEGNMEPNRFAVASPRQH